MALKLLKTPLIFACFVLVVFLMRQNNLTPSKGLRHSLRMLGQRVLASGSRPSVTLCEGIVTEDSYSASEVEKANNVGDSLAKTRGGNPFEEWVVNGSEDTVVDDYVIGLIPLIAPWPVLAIITLFTCIGFITNWCCIFGCCKSCCKCCKCCKPAKEQKKMKIYMAISGLFLVSLLGSAAAGLSFAPKVSKGMNMTFCTALISVENLVHGETEQEWLGFTGILGSLKNVQTKFITTVDSLNTIAGNPTALNAAYNAAVTSNQKLYDDNNAVTAPRADPAETTAYKPDYVANLGPVTTSGTSTYLIKKELDGWNQAITDAKTAIDTSVGDLQGQKGTIKSAIDSGIDTAQSISDSMNEIIDTLGDNGKTIKDAVKAMGAVLVALFAVNLVFSIVAIGSIGMVKMMKIKFFNKILHFSWCVINLMTLLGFLISSVTMPVSIVMIESCEVFHLTLNDQAFFETVTNKLFSGGSSDAKSILNTCFYGSGLALDELGLTSQLDLFNSIYDQLDKVDAQIPLSGTYTVASPPPSVVIPLQMTLVNAYLSGTAPDSTYTVTDLKTLNKGTNSAAYSCISLQDTWMLNSASCPSSGTYTFASADAANKNAGSKVCMGFDQWMSPTVKNINSRYDITYFPASCTNPSLTRVKALVGTTGNGFVGNREAISTIFTDINTDLTDVSNKHEDFSKEVVTFVNSIKDVKTKVADLQDSLVGKVNGLIPNTNCKFIGSDLRKLQISMCASLASSLYESTVCMIVMSVMALLATIFTFCLAKRFSINKDKKIEPSDREMAKHDPFQDPFSSPTPN